MGNICKRLWPQKPGPKTRTVVPNLTLSEEIHYRHKNHPNRDYPSNRVKTTKYTILTFLPKNLFEQFHRYANIYFIFVALLNWVPGITAFGKEISMLPIFFVLAVTAIKDGYEDFRRYQSDKRVNTASCRRYSKQDGRYVKATWSELHVGDFVHLSCNEIIPADILLLKSSDPLDLCHIETSNIDGETNLKQRFTVSDVSNTAEDFNPELFTHSIECELPSTDIYKFHGNVILNEASKVPITQKNLLLRGCLVRNTDYVEGIVVYAGPETKAMLNNRGPRYKRSKLERRMNRDLVYCVVILLFMCFFCAIGSGIWIGDYDDVSVVPFIPQQTLDDYSPTFQGFIVFWTYIIIFQAVIPLPLYVSLEIIKLVQVYFIQNDKELYYEPTNRRVECRALNITEDLGQVEYLFSDKTGTLTENQMDFKSCTIGGVDFPHGCDLEEAASNLRSSRRSMSNVSRSSWDMLNLKLEPDLQMTVSTMSLRSLDSIDTSVTPQTKRVQDFFLLMAICNTVVVSPHPHKDELDASGLLINDNPPGLDKHSSETLSPPGPNGLKFRGIENNGFYRDDEDYPRAATPSESSVTSASVMSEATLAGRYDAESPDEMALVKAASTYGCRLMKRMPNAVTVLIPEEGMVDYSVLHILPFDSVRKRMSIIVRSPFSKEVILYTKGADTAIFSILHKHYRDKEEERKMYELTKEHLNGYAKKGLRTLCMAKKTLDPDYYERWRRKHLEAENSMDDRDKKVFDSTCLIEQDLELLGATGIEDKLQEGVPETIANLRKAGIKVWVLTGDKQETAIQVAYASQLISTDEKMIIINAKNKEETVDLLQHHIEQARLDASQTARTNHLHRKKNSPERKKPELQVSLVIDGRTLAYALHPDVEKLFLELAKNCSSVVCCRSTPIQKGEVVKLVRDELKQLTLAIGDGANDVSMIQTADVGVGISGQEGMQAVMASDFAIARFKFLQRLMFVHGHWCYDRLARFALYMFYKNPLPNFTIFWFQIYSGFTGAITMDSYYLLLLHVVFTALPPAVNGILDKDVSAETLLTRLELYKTSQQGRSYTTVLFWIYVLDAFIQSLILHFVPNLAYSDSDTGLWEMGTTITVCLILTMLLFLGIETWCWTWVHWVVLTGSFLLFWIFAIFLGAFCVVCDPPSNPYWVMQNTVTSPTHWLLVCLTCTAALLPRFVFRSLQTSLFPNEILKARLDEKRGLIRAQKFKRSSRKKRKNSMNLTPTASASVQKQAANGLRPSTTSSVEVTVDQNSAVIRDAGRIHLPEIQSIHL